MPWPAESPAAWEACRNSIGWTCRTTGACRGRSLQNCGRTSLDELDIFATPVCAPAAWEDWLETIGFDGRLCETATDATIDLAVVYTPAARTVSGNIEAVIDLMVRDTNQALRASGVQHRIALVERSEVQYTESGGDLRDDLRRLANPSDGYIDEVHALRDQVGADLVHLIVHELEPETCGRAFVQGAFGVSQRFCAGWTFAHEFGHNLGLRHDRYQVLHHESGPYPHPGVRLRQPAGARAGPFAQAMAYDHGLLGTVRLPLCPLSAVASLLESAPDLERRPDGRRLRRRRLGD